MGMKIGITNLKGGVGKTTLSINIAVQLAHLGHSVCIVDTDTNNNALDWFSARDEGLKKVFVVAGKDYKKLIFTIREMEKIYDFIIMDGTPSISPMASAIIVLSDVLVIPIRASANDFRTMEGFMNVVENGKVAKNGLPICFVVNEFNENITMDRQVKDALKEYNVPTLHTVIRNRVAYRQSMMDGTGVVEQSDLKAKLEIEKLTEELIAFATTEIVL